MKPRILSGLKLMVLVWGFVPFTWMTLIILARLSQGVHPMGHLITSSVLLIAPFVCGFFFGGRK